MSDTAIILTAFGTSTEARDTYAFFEARVREQFPRHDILWAYTSRALREKMASHGMVWQSPEELLKDLPGRGYTQAVIQSLHIVPGKEYEKIAAAAARAPLPVVVGAPLLSSRHDNAAVLDGLAEDIADPAACVTVLAGHGTPHSAGQDQYRQFAALLRQRYPRNVLLSMVEGDPTWDAALAAIRQSGLCKVRFVPLMFVAGDHIINDVLGQTDSWASQLAGYALEAQERGLGFNDKVVKIYFQHLQTALNRVNI